MTAVIREGDKGLDVTVMETKNQSFSNSLFLMLHVDVTGRKLDTKVPSWGFYQQIVLRRVHQPEDDVGLHNFLEVPFGIPKKLRKKIRYRNLA